MQAMCDAIQGKAEIDIISIVENIAADFTHAHKVSYGTVADYLEAQYDVMTST
jgi:hypothetical protein